MAQAVQTRDATRAGWRRLIPRLRIDPVRTGACLALTAWLLQAYAGTFVDGRDRLARSIESAETRREIWLIEYNSSLIRTPRNSRVTARAAYQVVRNTHELLALSDIAQGGLLTRSGPILEQLQKKQDWVRQVFDARDYGQLVSELDNVSQLFESRSHEHTIGMPTHAGIIAWWQHIPPVMFLAGVLLCFRGRRKAYDDE